MQAANDNVPLALTRKQAASMCGLSLSGFDSWVRRGIVPGPITGTRRWSRCALETVLSGAIVGTSANDNISPFEDWKRKHAGAG